LSLDEIELTAAFNRYEAELEAARKAENATTDANRNKLRQNLLSNHRNHKMLRRKPFRNRLQPRQSPQQPNQVWRIRRWTTKFSDIMCQKLSGKRVIGTKAYAKPP